MKGCVLAMCSDQIVSDCLHGLGARDEAERVGSSLVKYVWMYNDSCLSMSLVWAKAYQVLLVQA